MKMRIGLVFIILGLLLISQAFGLTAEEKAYFDQQNQKSVAQINAKIDSALQASEKTLRSEFQDSTVHLREELEGYLRKGVKSLAFGIFGFILVALAIFKVIDLKLTSTRAIENYEKQLKDEKKALDIYRKELDAYRDSMVTYFNNRLNYLPKQNQPPSKSFNDIKGKIKFPKWMKILFVIFVICIIGIIGLKIYSFFG